MSSIPDNLQYTKEHEWVLATGNTFRMGITDYAQGALGDIVYVQLPKVGESVVADKVCGEVESTKSVSEIFAPKNVACAALSRNSPFRNPRPIGAATPSSVLAAIPLRTVKRAKKIGAWAMIGKHDASGFVLCSL